MIWRRHRIALVVLAAAVFGPAAASAACIDAPELAAYQTALPEDFALGPTRSDRLGRVVAPVSVNGEGPFRFIVDTGANRSVLSEGLAERLGLIAHGTGDVHSVHGVITAPLTRVRSLEYGDLALNGDAMPILHGPMLAGEHGLLGVDGMRGRRLRLDFVRNCIEIIPSQGAPRLRTWVRVRGELRFGHLVVVRGTVNRVPTNLLIDTGSNTSLANVALMEAIGARIQNRRGASGSVAYTAGDPIFLTDSMLLPRMRFGDLEVRNVRAYVGDFHIFRLWNLIDEPTLLVGMDVLSQSRGLAIDYRTGSVYFHTREPAPSVRLLY